MEEKTYTYRSPFTPEERKAKIAAQQKEEKLLSHLSSKVCGHVYGENFTLWYHDGGTRNLQLSPYFRGVVSPEESGSRLSVKVEKSMEWRNLIWFIRIFFFVIAGGMFLTSLFENGGFALVFEILFPIAMIPLAFLITAFLNVYAKEQANSGEKEVLLFLQRTLLCSSMPEKAPENEASSS